MEDSRRRIFSGVIPLEKELEHILKLLLPVDETTINKLLTYIKKKIS